MAPRQQRGTPILPFREVHLSAAEIVLSGLLLRDTDLMLNSSSPSGFYDSSSFSSCLVVQCQIDLAPPAGGEGLRGKTVPFSSSSLSLGHPFFPADPSCVEVLTSIFGILLFKDPRCLNFCFPSSSGTDYLPSKRVSRCFRMWSTSSSQVVLRLTRHFVFSSASLPPFPI